MNVQVSLSLIQLSIGFCKILSYCCPAADLGAFAAVKMSRRCLQLHPVPGIIIRRLGAQSRAQEGASA